MATPFQFSARPEQPSPSPSPSSSASASASAFGQKLTKSQKKNAGRKARKKVVAYHQDEIAVEVEEEEEDECLFAEPPPSFGFNFGFGERAGFELQGFSQGLKALPTTVATSSAVFSFPGLGVGAEAPKVKKVEEVELKEMLEGGRLQRKGAEPNKEVRLSSDNKTHPSNVAFNLRLDSDRMASQIAEINRLEEEVINSLNRELREEKERNKSLSDSYSWLEGLHQKEQRDHDATKGKLEDEINKHRETQSLLDDATGENMTLQEAEGFADKRIRDLEGKVADHYAVVEQQKGIIAGHNQITSNARTKAIQQDADNKGLSSQLTASEIKVQNLTTQLTNAVNENATLKSTIAELEEKDAMLENIKSVLEDNLADPNQHFPLHPDAFQIDGHSLQSSKQLPLDDALSASTVPQTLAAELSEFDFGGSQHSDEVDAGVNAGNQTIDQVLTQFIGAFQEIEASSITLSEVFDSGNHTTVQVLSQSIGAFQDIEGSSGVLPEVVDSGNQTAAQVLTQSIGAVQEIEGSAAILPEVLDAGNQTETPAIPVLHDAGNQTETTTIPVLYDASNQTNVHVLTQCIGTVQEIEGSAIKLPLLLDASNQTDVTPAIPGPIQPATPQIVYIDRSVYGQVSDHNPIKCWLTVEYNFFMLIGALIYDAWVKYVRGTSNVNRNVILTGSSAVLQNPMRGVPIDNGTAAFGVPTQAQGSQTTNVPNAGIAASGRDNTNSQAIPSSIESTQPQHGTPQPDYHNPSDVDKAVTKSSDSQQSPRERLRAEWMRHIAVFAQHCTLYYLCFQMYLALDQRKIWLHSNEMVRSLVNDILLYRANVDSPSILNPRYYMSDWLDTTIRMSVLHVVQLFMEYTVKANHIPG